VTEPRERGREPSPLDERLDLLVRRIEVLEAERTIIDVLGRYCAAIDDGDAESWVDLFTPDAVWEVGGPAARINFEIVGHAELRRFAEHHTRPPEAWHKHCIVEPRVDVRGDNATSSSYTFRLDGFPDGPVLQSFGRYLDRFELHDGRWLIARHTVEVQSSRPSPFGYRGSVPAPSEGASSTTDDT